MSLAGADESLIASSLWVLGLLVCSCFIVHRCNEISHLECFIPTSDPLDARRSLFGLLTTHYFTLSQ